MRARRGTKLRNVWLLALFAGMLALAQSPAQAHAELVSSSPAAGSLLPAQAIPTVVKLTFSEDINPTLSGAVVLDSRDTKHKINTEASFSPNSTELDIPLPGKLPSGSYLVVWRSDSTDDGHILEDAFCFAIANPDGSRPASGPCTVPAGTVPGLGATTTKGLSAPSLVGAFGDWIADLAALALVGGLIWQIAVLRLGIGLPSAALDNRGVVLAARREAVDHFSRVLWWILGAAFVGNVILLLGAALQTGAPLEDGLRAILTRSQFGTFWFLREIATLAGFLVLVLIPFTGLQAVIVSAPDKTGTPAAKPRKPQPNALALATAGDNAVASTGTTALDAEALLAERRRLWRDGLTLAAGLVLLYAIAMSGHAASVTGPLAPFSVSVDVLHLVATSAWVGGIFYIAAILLPAIARTSPAERGRVLVNLLPLFSPVAAVSVVVLTLAGIFNTDAHLASLNQFVTTGYGRALFVKLVLVAGMIAISAWHVFGLRPQLARDLAQKGAGKQVPPLVVRFSRWLQIEAALGVGVILCVALMGALAGSLGSSASSTSTQPVVLKQTTAQGMGVTIAFTSTQTGSQTITVYLKDSAGKDIVDPAYHVTVNATMQDMFMGTQTYPLQLVDDDKDYVGNVDFLMSGHWQLDVTVTHTVNGHAQTDHTAFIVIAK